MDSEEEALFRSYPYAVYYVQSPSTVSHATTAEFRNIHHESLPEPEPETFATNSHHHHPTTKESAAAANRLALSHYSNSSSRGSTNWFISHEKKIPYNDDVQSHDDHDQGSKTIVVADDDDHHGYNKEDHHERDVYYEEDDVEEYDYFEKNNEDDWRRMFSFGYSDSAGWKLLQITWRFVVSVVVALVVFYLLTKPPPPNMSIKISRVPQFELAEGVDATGVTTKLLTCNCSIDVMIDNKSKLFRLRIHPPFLALSFGNLPFAVAQGPDEVEVGIDGVQYLRLHVGTRNKPMYGAGRSMQDLLESKKLGLPLAVQIELRSSFDVLWGLINPKFHHQAQCFIFVGNIYDKKHRTQDFISTCTLS